MELVVLVILIIIGVGTFVVIYLRNRRNKSNSRSYIQSLHEHGPNIKELNENVCLRVSSLPAARLQSQALLSTTFRQLGKFRIRYQNKIDRDRILLVTESYDEDFVALTPGKYGNPGMQSTTNIFHMHRFIIKYDEKTIDVFSDIHETLKEKLVKAEFANLLFSYLETGKVPQADETSSAA